MMKTKEQQMTYTFSTELFSDLHKDVYGHRPRGHWFYDANTTDDERQVEWDYLCKCLDKQIEEDNAEKAANLEAFRIQVKQNLALGAKDEQEAIRWVVESLNPHPVDLSYGGEWVCWELGLAFSNGYIFNQACRDLSKKLEKEIA
jgi:hypothetical protein